MSRLIRDRVHKSLQQVERRGVEGAAAQGDFGSKERLEILPGKLHPAEGMELEKKNQKKLNAVSSKQLHKYCSRLRKIRKIPPMCFFALTIPDKSGVRLSLTMKHQRGMNMIAARLRMSCALLKYHRILLNLCVTFTTQPVGVTWTEDWVEVLGFGQNSEHFV